MKKRHYILIFSAIVLLLGTVCICSACDGPAENSLPYMIMADGTIYQAKDTAEEIPDDAVQCTITKTVLENKMPDENGCANFGEVGMKYWKTENAVYIQDIYDYTVFLPIEE